MAHPVTLSSLSQREAIIDAMTRCLYGADINDRELWDSAWTKNTDEAVFDFNGTVFQPKSAIDERVFDRIAPLVTHHTVSNVRVDVKDGGKTAYMSAYVVAYHYRPGEGADPKTQGLTSGVIYYLDVVKDESVSEEFWRIQKWAMKLVWLDGDRTIVE